MKKNQTTRKPRHLWAFFFVSLLCSISISAQQERADSAKQEERTQAITGKVTDNKESTLAGAQIAIETACPCEPCTKRGDSCSVCCPPGFTPETLAITTADAGGSFKIAIPTNATAGSYSLKVVSGQFSRSVNFEIDKKDAKLDFKVPKDTGIKVKEWDTTADVSIPLATNRIG